MFNKKAIFLSILKPGIGNNRLAVYSAGACNDWSFYVDKEVDGSFSF